MEMNIGVHVSIAGGVSKAVERASELGCTSMQIFCRSPRSWGVKDIEEAEVERFRELRAERGISTVVVHTTYLINLASPDDALRRRSIELFKWEVRAAESIGADFIVTHMGSSTGEAHAPALSRVGDAIRETADEGLGRTTTLLLENTAGSGHTIGARLEDVSDVIGVARASGIDAGLCFDTCHGFASGLQMKAAADAASVVAAIEERAGAGSLRVVHLNDSKGECGSRLDRHEHIGEGRIGRAFFKAFLNRPEISGLPLILETPKKSELDDRRNLKTVAGFRRKS